MNQTYQNLQKRKVGSLANAQTWSLENIKDGLEYYHEMHGAYPTSREVDHFEYLPSARSIQRKFGGLVKIRTQLGLSGPNDFTRGETRSKKAQEADKRAKIYEAEFFNFLSNHIAEMRIHEHKVIRPGDVSCDFFVYTSETSGVVLDLFYAADLFNVSKIVNIKFKKYLDVRLPIIFVVVGNELILQDKIDQMIANRKITLPSNMKVLCESAFKSNFDKLVSVTS